MHELLVLYHIHVEAKESLLEKSLMISLFESTTGQYLRIQSLPNGVMQAQFIRLGLTVGQRVRCIERLPGGTIILERNRQHIAIGHELAKRVMVFILVEKELCN